MVNVKWSKWNMVKVECGQGRCNPCYVTAGTSAFSPLLSRACGDFFPSISAEDGRFQDRKLGAEVLDVLKEWFDDHFSYDVLNWELRMDDAGEVYMEKM